MSARKIPDYHKIIKKPMDLQTMQKVSSRWGVVDVMGSRWFMMGVVFPLCLEQNCNNRLYLNKDQFLSDLNQIVENSITYNGPSSPYTQTAQTMRDVGLKLLEQV